MIFMPYHLLYKQEFNYTHFKNFSLFALGNKLFY